MSPRVDFNPKFCTNTVMLVYQTKPNQKQVQANRPWHVSSGPSSSSTSSWLAHMQGCFSAVLELVEFFCSSGPVVLLRPGYFEAMSGFGKHLILGGKPSSLTPRSAGAEPGGRAVPL